MLGTNLSSDRLVGDETIAESGDPAVDVSAVVLELECCILGIALNF